MSSIDKYVESTAHNCNPNVRVRKVLGRIQGYIGATKVFDIADRDGYLNDNEKSIIESGIRAYELQDEEYRRREAIRLENERIAVRNELKRNLTASHRALSEAYTSSSRAYAQATSNMNLVDSIDKIRGVNLEGVRQRAERLENKVRECFSSIDREYQSKLRALEDFENSIDDNASTETFIAKKKELKRIPTNLSNVTVPVDEIDNFKAEIEQLKKAITQVKVIENELNKISDTGLVGSIAQNALVAIREQNIVTLEDVDNLVKKLNGQLEEIKNVEFKQKLVDRADQIAILDGIIKTCSQIREYTVVQNYQASNYRAEIVEMANRVLNAYSSLRIAEYTTCSDEKINSTCNLVQEILIGANADERTLEDLKKLFTESECYRRDDLLQADNYADYKCKVEELTTRGMSLNEVERFDPHDYESQRLRLIEMLLKQDTLEAISNARVNYLMACKAMENMGYRMLKYDIGNEDINVSNTGANDALALEGIYVIPGCEGVVCRIIASERGIQRTLMGIVRPDGSATPVETVIAAAKKMEDMGEIEEYYGIYAQACETNFQVISAVDVETPNSSEIAAENCFVLAAEGEAYYDQIHAEASKEDKARWKTEAPKQTNIVVKPKKHEDDKSDRKRTSEKIHEQLRAKRAH